MNSISSWDTSFSLGSFLVVSFGPLAEPFLDGDSTHFCYSIPYEFLEDHVSQLDTHLCLLFIIVNPFVLILIDLVGLAWWKLSGVTSMASILWSFSSLIWAM